MKCVYLKINFNSCGFPWRAEEACISGAGIVGGWGAPDVGTQNQTLVLRESSEDSITQLDE